MNQLVFLVLILIIAIGLPLFFKINESYDQFFSPQSIKVSKN
jgi:uncharacterized protein HemY